MTRQGTVLFGLLLVQACSEPSSGSATPTAVTVVKEEGGDIGTGHFKRMVYENSCEANIEPKKNPAGIRERIFGLHLLMRGRGPAGDRDALILVAGSCDFLIGTAGGLEPGWHCDFYVYGLDDGLRPKSFEDKTLVPANDSVHLPWLKARDIRGYSGAASWFGEKPQLRLESEGELILNHFGIDGPGQLRASCPQDIRNGGNFYDMKGCRISWRHEWMPDKVYYVGNCGDAVTVPGLYVATEK